MDTLRNNALRQSALAALLLAVTGCGPSAAESDKPKPQAGVDTIFADVSKSTDFINAPAYADAAIQRVGQDVMHGHLGDRVRIVAVGNRSADNAVDVLDERSGYKDRLPAVRKHVEAALTALYDRSRRTGGDGSTNILYALEEAHVECSPNSRIKILSDGIAEDERFSAGKALAAGQPVRLPPPSTPFLKGCGSIEFIGIGMASQGGQTMSEDRREALIAGWRAYLGAAGMPWSSIQFTSIL